MVGRETLPCISRHRVCSRFGQHLPTAISADVVGLSSGHAHAAIQ